ncbi:MAG: CPBP family intramembrane metalloprotease [Gemmatimonadota bacterium]|nr:CPBP family intramembrane metalloprotease [Gemmatimonadota bacterium]MDE3128389.1 CPBP family intramembrane metalloprotease [Gemmatimonadota bacterium]MDE3217334.1 CPBP family intramembrane metalloprotease [Gemmatimonadota bacterium]
MTSSSQKSTARRQSYWAASRSPRYSLLFALPLLLLYEGLAAARPARVGSGEIRNGADVLLHQAAYAIAGPWGPLGLMAAIILLCAWLVYRDVRKSGGVRPGVFPLMMAESAVLALAFGLVVGTATAALLSHLPTMLLATGPIEKMDPVTRLMLSLGAGLYEELLFRVLLVGGLAFGGRVILGLSRATSGAIATIVGALVFSAFHYIGPYGEPLRLQSFVFRAISGVAFSVLYLTRGFGVTAWTHALYDVWVLLG